MKTRLTGADANDFLYAFEASRDYDPSGALEKIEAPVLAINSADDVVNPPELGLMEKLMPRVRTDATSSSRRARRRGATARTRGPPSGGSISANSSRFPSSARIPRSNQEAPLRKLVFVGVALSLCLGFSTFVRADDKPLSKEEERRKFHPRRTGMDAGRAREGARPADGWRRARPCRRSGSGASAPRSRAAASSSSPLRRRSPTPSSSRSPRAASGARTTGAAGGLPSSIPRRR